MAYLRARYYSSAQGRFTTRDVWEGDPNAPMSYNAWLYVYANPVNGVDPTGLQGPTPECRPPRICPTPTTPIVPPLTDNRVYGVPIGSTFDALEALLIRTAVEDFANRILGGPAAFTRNVKLNGIYKRTSVYERMGYDDTGGTFAIYLTPNLLYEYTERGYTHPAIDIYRPELFPKAKGTGVFPDRNPNVHPDELQKTTFKFTLAHELTHALQIGNREVYNSFVDTFWPLKCITIFGVQITLPFRDEPPTDQSIERNKQRAGVVLQQEVMADAVAARLYAPNLLNHTYDNWIDNVLRTKPR